jgi:transcriptional regulator with XRE-family HTH domain
MTKFKETENNLFMVGYRIREIRKDLSLTLEQLAAKTGLTKGLLSKIENFRTIPSLPVLAQIAQHLNVDMAELVSGISSSPPEKYTLIKASSRMEISPENSVGFIYNALLAKSIDDTLFEVFTLDLLPQAKRNLASTDGDEFIYILEGKIDFILGTERIEMDKGDALFFDGRIPHVSENKGDKKASLIAIYILEKNKAGHE